MEDTQIFCISSAHYSKRSLLHYQYPPHQSGSFFPISEPTLAHHLPKSVVYVRVYSRWCTFYVSMNSYKCNHHCIITQEGCPALKILCAPHSSLSHRTWKPLTFSVCTLLPFPECHVVGIIQYGAIT